MEFKSKSLEDLKTLKNNLHYNLNKYLKDLNWNLIDTNDILSFYEKIVIEITKREIYNKIINRLDVK